MIDSISATSHVKKACENLYRIEICCGIAHSYFPKDERLLIHSARECSAAFFLFGRADVRVFCLP